MGYTSEDIDMVKEHRARASDIEFPRYIWRAAKDNDAKTVFDWLGSSVDEGRLTSSKFGLTLLHFASLRGHTELASLLLQNGAVMDVYDTNGLPPILQVLKKSYVLVNELVALLYEWGASLEHHVPGDAGAVWDRNLQSLPIFHDEFVKRRCEIVNLNQRKGLIRQTCIVEKYIARKERYKVTTENARETFLVGRDNLKRRDRTPDDPGY